jgi:hypothetical protein
MSKPKTKKPKDIGKKKWREFEKMVARIEATLCQQGIKVASPDHVLDIVTGTSREVDASLRYQIGSSQVLITVECRDRKGVEDVQWIEQLVTKQRDIKADKCIAVSSAGFSSAAMKKGKHYGIEIRLVQEVKETDVLAWFDNLYMEVEYHTLSIFGVNFALATGGGMNRVQLADDLAAAFVKASWESPIVFGRDTNEWVGVQFLIEDCMKQGFPIYDMDVPLGQQYRRNIKVEGKPPSYTRTNNGTFDVSWLEIALDITRIWEEILLKDHLQYCNENKPLAYAAQGKLVIEGRDSYTFLVQRSADSPIIVNVDVRAHEPTPDGVGKYVVRPPT